LIKWTHLTTCAFGLACATAAHAIDVLVITNQSAQPWQINTEVLGEPPMRLTMPDGKVSLFKGKALTVPAGRTLSLQFLPWGATMPAKYQAMEAAPGGDGLPVRHLTFDVMDSKGTVCSAATYLVDSKTDKGSVHLDPAWIKTWAQPHQLMVKSQNDMTELVICTDFAVTSQTKAHTDKASTAASTE